MFILTPILGDFKIRAAGAKTQSGSGNSTRWIIEIQQHPDEINVALESAVRFDLLRRNGSVVEPSIHSFSFGAIGKGFYEAQPTLYLLAEGWELRASCVPARYILSIDILHSLYR
jgi:hypothetical protein